MNDFMNKVSSNKVIILVWTLLVGQSLAAQELDSLLLRKKPMEKIHPNQYFLRQEIPLFTASPFLMDSSQPEFYQATVGYVHGEGDLVESLMPQSYKNLQFYSQSRMHLGNGSFQGDFNYTKQLETKRPFLLQSLGNPFNPFLIGQEQLGLWTGDQVATNLAGNSARYLKGKFGNFFRTNYHVITSSMDAEPRPLYTSNEYTIEIGQNVQPTPQTEVGISGGIKRGNEENQIGAFAAQEFSLIFMRGLNTFSRTSFQSFTRNQFIKTLTFQLYGHHRFSENTFLFIQLENGSVHSRTRDGIAFPIEGGSSRGNTFKSQSGLMTVLKGWQYQ